MQIAHADTATAKPRRRSSPLRDYPSIFWLVAAIFVALAHRWIPDASWLLVHFVMLGALTHSILVWSLYFSEALLKAPVDNPARKTQSARILTMLVGSALVIVGYTAGWWHMVILGAVAVGAAVIWHGIAILTLMRASLPGRFRVTMYYYLLAAVSLVAGATFGAILANTPGEPEHGRLLAAHTLTNLLGWVGMTVVGTLVTFWPTMLRTKMDEKSDRVAKIALPIFVVALIVIDLAALLASPWMLTVGIALYLVGIGIWGRIIVTPFRAKPPREFATASVSCALLWAVIGLIWVAVLAATSDDWAHLTASYLPVASIFVGGFAAQLLIGALSYLVPTVLGGGPSVVRASLERFNTWTTPRLVAANVAVILVLGDFSGPLLILAVLAGAAALGSFIFLMFAGIKAAIAARRALVAGDPIHTDPKPVWSSKQLIATLAALVIAVTIAIGADPAAVGFATAKSGSNTVATGQTVHLTVKAVELRFEPSSVKVNKGDRLVITLVNETNAMVHDLSINGQATPRLTTGESAELDLGVISDSAHGWCTIAGHKQAGMVFDIIVADSPAVTPSDADHGDHAGHGTHTDNASKPDPTTPLADWVDPVLAPLTNERHHKITIEVTETPLEVAPGVWQNRWTFNGGQVGPTLHGRVGDTFEVTLINNGTMGHSIDFHASYLAPDTPMRTIAPGEQLVYDFTANRAGVWMYHCGTPPVSNHIATGMHGAVVIEPEEGLPQVDREYIMVQSEIYHQDGTGTSAETAADLDSDKVAEQDADYVVFNGIAFQYKQRPIEVKVGERIRFWVLDAGPNRPSSFHIVGTQWDTVYFEGGYLLKDGRDAFGQTSGGSQALGLQAAQGGFVETVFPEAGHYAMVSHIFSDAESGALGVIEVTD